MPEYKLVIDETGAVFVDEHGQTADLDTALSLLEMLHRTYERRACVYLLVRRATSLYKIGMTSQPINNRISQVRYDEDAYDIGLTHSIPCSSITKALKVEKTLHKLFAEQRVYGDWFSLLPDDVFCIESLTEDSDIEFIWQCYQLDKFALRDPVTAKPKERAAVLGHAAQVRTWLDAFEKKWGES